MKTIKPGTKPGSPVFGKIEAGDTVRVRTRDGRDVRFVVEQIDGDALVTSGGARYTRDDIVQLQRRSASVGTTILVSAGVGFLLAILLARNSEPWM